MTARLKIDAGRLLLVIGSSAFLMERSQDA
jgi:hypothetical protein